MKAVIHTTLLVIILASGLMAQGIPAAAEVKSVQIKFDAPKGVEKGEFNCGLEDWDAIRSQLLPAKEDPKPALWEWLGSVKITKKDGQAFAFELYKLTDGQSAFSIGRTYYRGGDYTKMIEVLHKAFVNATNKKPVQ